MKSFGLLLILVGIWNVMTIVVWWLGVILIVIGALCYRAGRSTPKSELAGFAHASLWSLIILSVAYGAFFWGSAVRLQMQPKNSTVQQLPVPRPEQNRVQPVRHAEPAKASPAR